MYKRARPIVNNDLVRNGVLYLVFGFWFGFFSSFDSVFSVIQLEERKNNREKWLFNWHPYVSIFCLVFLAFDMGLFVCLFWFVDLSLWMYGPHFIQMLFVFFKWKYRETKQIFDANQFWQPKNKQTVFAFGFGCLFFFVFCFFAKY